MIFLLLATLGCGLFFVGTRWPIMYPATDLWTNEKARRLPEVNDRLAELRYIQSQPISMHGGDDRGVLQRELIDLTRERARLIADFEQAMNVPQRGSTLTATGIVILALAVMVWCVMRLRELMRQEIEESPLSD
jgi:hypothetical protein